MLQLIRRRRLLFVLSLGLGLVSPSPAQRPHLLVLIVAEQFRADYLDVYRTGFSADGFGRLLSEGSVFRRCRFSHLTTLGAPNAATLATGAYPELHGIVGDRWYDPAAQSIVEAETVPEPGGAKVSPRNLVGSTLADELALATGGRSQVVAVSDRRSPAVMLGGRKPAGCYWIDSQGLFATAPYYADSTPGWVREFNQGHEALRHWGAAWRALGADESSPPLRVLQTPKPMSFDQFLLFYRASPFAVEDVFALAERALEAEQLGQGDYTDLLVVNLSATAQLGLETGAYSPLMRDLVLRLDRSLAGFLGRLEEQFDPSEVTVVFSGLHGIPPLAEDPRQGNEIGGRVSGATVVAAMNQALESRFGQQAVVEKYIYPFVYLAATVPQSRRREAVAVAGAAASQVEGVLGYYAPGGDSSPAALQTALRRSRRDPRSGDLMLLYEPYFVEAYSQRHGTTSGSPYRYDTDVPLIFLGPRFRAQSFEQEVDASSVAPTLSAILEIAAPSLATGKVLDEALLPSSPPE